jgi:hypothetical protein
MTLRVTFKVAEAVADKMLTQTEWNSHGNHR